jgi:hypothetical protein
MMSFDSLFVAGILPVEEYADATTDHQRREYDADQHFGFVASFRPL